MTMTLTSAMDAYLAYRESAGFRLNTVKNDRQAIERLLRVTGDTPIDRIGPAELDALLGDMLTSRKYAPGTVNATQSSLSAFFRWCRDRGHTPPHHNPIAGRRYVPQQDAAKLRIPLSDFWRVLDAAERPRDRALIACGLFTMLRQSEIVTLRVGDLDLTAGTLSATIWKTYQTDTLPITPDFRPELVRWITAYQDECGPLDPSWFLIPAIEVDGFQTFRLRPEAPISRSADIVRRVLERAGFTADRVGVHVLRRSAARAVFQERAKAGYDSALREVSAWLHHRSVTTTELYLGLDQDRAARDRHYASEPMYPSLQGDNVVRIGDNRGNTISEAV